MFSMVFIKPIQFQYLTLVATESNVSIQLIKNETDKSIDLTGIQYKTNTDDNFINYLPEQNISLNNPDDYVQFRNINSTLSLDINNFAQFVITGNGKVKAVGNIASLITFDRYTPYCFYSLFKDCTRLTTAPYLSSTELSEGCYYRLFYGCTSLSLIPELPAERLYTSCYRSMFDGCTSLQVMPKIFATNLRGATNCCNSMFARCTSLTETYPLLAESIGTASYYAMFNGCTSLVKAPEIMATSISAGQGVQAMFQNCTSLNEIKVHFTAWNATGFTNWVRNVAESGTFICPSALSDERGESRIPVNWTFNEIK